MGTKTKHIWFKMPKSISKWKPNKFSGGKRSQTHVQRSLLPVARKTLTRVKEQCSVFVFALV